MSSSQQFSSIQSLFCPVTIILCLGQPVISIGHTEHSSETRLAVASCDVTGHCSCACCQEVSKNDYVCTIISILLRQSWGLLYPQHPSTLASKRSHHQQKWCWVHGLSHHSSYSTSIPPCHFVVDDKCRTFIVLILHGFLWNGIILVIWCLNCACLKLWHS